jgi:plastocyanin
MDGRLRHLGVLVLILVIATLASAAGPTPSALAEGPQTWQILVNNVSPEGRNWSFNAFYPDYLQAHPGDTIVFILAPNPQAFHTVMVLAQALTPLEMWSGFAGGFAQPNPFQHEQSQPTRTGDQHGARVQRPANPMRGQQLQATYFNSEVPPDGDSPPCGRAGATPCVVADVGDVSFGVNSGVMLNPPPGGQGNTSFAVTLAPDLPLGAYYFMSLVDGPPMSGRIDVMPASVPVQSAAVLQANARRQYDADLAWLAGHDRVSNPPEESRQDGTKIWRADAGRGSPDQRLSINAFSPSQMVVVAGDTVVWTNRSPWVVPHTISGFVTSPGGTLPDLYPFEVLCVDPDGTEHAPPPGSFPPDIWNTCVGSEANNFTEFAVPSAPSGAPYSEGGRTSGLLLSQKYLDSPSGDGLPFSSSYAVTFPNPGTYAYVCVLHPGMEGVVLVVPKPMPR